MLRSLSFWERVIVRLCGIAYGALIVSLFVTRPSSITYLIGGILGLILSTPLYLLIGFFVSITIGSLMNPYTVAKKSDEELGRPARITTAILMVVLALISIYAILK
jgi:hypothetical protein